jgi:hypothetical protein
MPVATTSLAELQIKAAAAWRALVKATAKTNRQPDGRDIIDNAIILGIDEPGDTFQAEVQALREHTAATADVKRLRADEVVEAVAMEERAVRLAALEAEAEELRRHMFAKSWSLGSDIASAESTIARLEKAHPFLAVSEEASK